MWSSSRAHYDLYVTLHPLVRFSSYIDDASLGLNSATNEGLLEQAVQAGQDFFSAARRSGARLNEKLAVVASSEDIDKTAGCQTTGDPAHQDQVFGPTTDLPTSSAEARALSATSTWATNGRDRQDLPCRSTASCYLRCGDQWSIRYGTTRATHRLWAVSQALPWW
eukprot:9077877-Pyramimonas_sp.AAC.1